MTDVGTDFYLRDSGSILEGAEPRQVQSIQLCGSGRPDILLCIGVEGPGGEGLEPGKSLILLRQGIRCPEILRGHPVRDLVGGEEAVLRWG